MQPLIYRCPLKGRLVLLTWGALLGLTLFGILQLWYTTLALYALLGWGVLLALLWWRSGLFIAELQPTIAQNQSHTSTYTLTLHRGRWFRTCCYIPCHSVFACALFSTPLLRLCHCSLLAYYTAGHTFLLPPLATPDAQEMIRLCHHP